MVQNLDDVMNKIKAIKGEMDVVEYRVINTRTHVESIEKNVEKISREVIEGFHSVSGKVNRFEEHLDSKMASLEESIVAKVNQLEEIILKLEREVDSLLKK